MSHWCVFLIFLFSSWAIIRKAKNTSVLYTQTMQHNSPACDWWRAQTRCCWRCRGPAARRRRPGTRAGGNWPTWSAAARPSGPLVRTRLVACAAQTSIAARPHIWEWDLYLHFIRIYRSTRKDEKMWDHGIADRSVWRVTVPRRPLLPNFRGVGSLLGSIRKLFRPHRKTLPINSVF